MSRTRIKFCGMTYGPDAQHAADLGVDAVGLILHSNTQRRIDLDGARQAVRHLPPYVTRVGVFVNASIEFVHEAGRRLRLGAVQLHGDEGPDYIAQLADFDVIKALRVEPATIRGTLDRWRSSVRDGGCGNLVSLLLDGGTGGSGVANDFGLIQTLRDEGRFDGLPPIILAGGLNADTVGLVIRALRPYAVDVSSGIEAEPGKKSRDRMNAFVAAVAAADGRYSTPIP